MDQQGDGSRTEIDPRTYLAAERTLLAWIRTGLAMMGFGFVVARFGVFLRELAVVHDLAPQPQFPASVWVGMTLVLLGVVVNLCAAFKHWQLLSRLAHGQSPRMHPLSLATAAAVVLAIVGLLMAWYLGIGIGNVH